MNDTFNPNTPSRAAIAEFSPARLYWLIRNRLFQDLVPLGIGAAIILGINLLLFLLGNAGGFFNHTAGTLWNIGVIAACALLASGGFREMQSGKSGTDWLLLPATPLEKYLAALIELLVVVPLVAFLLATGMSALIAGIESVRHATNGGATLPGGSIWTPFTWNHPAFWGCFLVGNLLLLIGSAVFRKQAFIKTIGMLVVYAVALSILVTILLWIVLQFNPHYGSIDLQVEGTSFSIFRVDGNTATPEWVTNALAWIWGVLWFGITPLAALLFGYFRVREKEAKDAVQ